MSEIATGGEMIEIDKLKEIFEIVKNLSSSLDIDTSLKRIGEAAEKLTDSEASSIMLVDETKQHLYFRTAFGEKGEFIKKIKIKIGEGIAGNVAVTKTSLIVNDVSKDKRFTGTVDSQSGFHTKSILAVPIVMQTKDSSESELMGVIEVLNKKNSHGYNEEDKEILESLASLSAVVILNAKFLENHRNFFTNMIEILVSSIESVRPKYFGRYWKMAQISTQIARNLNIQPDSEKYKNIYFGSLLQDIGYLSPKFRLEMENVDNVLQRIKIEKNHVLYGVEILNKINLLKNIIPVVKCHHENYDGTGYPEQLKGEKIPLEARIVSISEYIEELKINNISKEDIIKMLQQQSATRFDPKIVEVAISVLSVTTEDMI